MAIYDCFQYFNEDHILDMRFNILNKYVDYFVISESTRTHQGEPKKINFNTNNFPKFKNKIKFIVADYQSDKKLLNHVGGESPIEQHQRNSLLKGLEGSNDNDLIILSDSDEIPDLEKLNEIKSTTKFTAFSHKMYMYKLNILNIDESNWIGSRICKKKYFNQPQYIRNLKFKNYPFWRFDKFRYQIIQGGWHFSFLSEPKEIIKKIKSFSHGEFNKEEYVDLNTIEDKILSQKDIFGRGFQLKKVNLDHSFPKYILNNKTLLKKWIS